SEAAGERGGMADRRRHGRLLPAVEAVRDDPGLDRPHPVYRLGGHRERRRVDAACGAWGSVNGRGARVSYLRFASRVRPEVSTGCFEPLVYGSNILPSPDCEDLTVNGPFGNELGML